MPMPPIHWRKQRQKLMDGGKASRPVNTVAPVVKPDTVSKYASVTDIGLPACWK
jgi:hypothetical protein